jgi:hypothetical protein
MWLQPVDDMRFSYVSILYDFLPFLVCKMQHFSKCVSTANTICYSFFKGMQFTITVQFAWLW